MWPQALKSCPKSNKSPNLVTLQTDNMGTLRFVSHLRDTLKKLIFQLDEIEFDRSPLDTFETSDGNKISFVDYYKKTHDIEIKDHQQPLLVHLVKRLFGS